MISYEVTVTVTKHYYIQAGDEEEAKDIAFEKFNDTYHDDVEFLVERGCDEED